MNSSTKNIVGLLIFALISTGCGVTQTDATATKPSLPTLVPTTLPSPIPTPEPQILELQVLTPAGSPIEFAKAILIGEEVGKLEMLTNKIGQVLWEDIIGSSFTINVYAQGYFPLEEPISLLPGTTTLTIELIKDPDGITTEEACGAGEKVILLADMQDMSGNGLTTFKETYLVEDQGWEIGVDEENKNNIVLRWVATEELTFGRKVGFMDVIPDNSVLQFLMKISPNGQAVIHYKDQVNGFSVGELDYDSGEYGISFFDFSPWGDMLKLFRSSDERVFEPIFDFNSDFVDDKWHSVKISNFEGEVTIIVDGKVLGTWIDDLPLPPGSLYFNTAAETAGEKVEFDNFIVCQ